MRREKLITSANVLKVAVETNGIQGGNVSHGGKTEFYLQDGGSTCWDVEVRDESGQVFLIPYPDYVKITFKGDTELRTATKALRWAGKTLRNMRKLVGSKETR